MSDRVWRVVLSGLFVAAWLSLSLASSASAAGPAYAMTIANGATTDMTLSNGVYEPTADGANLSPASLQDALASGSVEVGGADAGTIQIESAMSAPTATNGLVFDSGGGGSITIDGQSLTTGGSQTYLSPVLLSAGATALTTTQAAFDSTVDGPGDLSVDSTQETEFDANVGTAAQLGSLTVDGPGVTVFGAADQFIWTTGNQVYDQPLEIAASGYDDLQSSSGSTAVHNTVDGPGGLGLSAATTATADHAVGGTTPLAYFEMDGSINLGASVSTTGGQVYNGPVSLSADVSAQSSATSGIAIAFMGSVEGAHSLTADTGAITEFKSDVGDVTPLASLMANGSVILYGGVSTTGDQTYAGQVALAANDVFADGQGGTIAFEQPLIGDSLTMSGPGALDLLASNSQSSTILDGGTAAFSPGGLGTGPVAVNGGTIEWSTGNTTDISPQLTVGSAGGVLDTNGNDVTFASAIGGDGTLTKTAAGALSLAASGDAAYADGLVVDGGTVSVTGSTVATPISVHSGGTLSCTANGTLNGAVTNDGGTLAGAPAAPTVTAATDEAGPTASVSFTPGAANCNPVTYTAQTTGGGFSSNPLATGPLTVNGLAAGTTYGFTVTATNPLGATVSGNSISATTPDDPAITISSPTQGASYAFNQGLSVSYACSDSTGPGIASCKGSVGSGSPLDTSTPGQHSFTVTATSSDGYTASRTVSYTVAAPPAPSNAISSPAANATNTLAAPPAPSITISSPATNATYTLDAVVDAGYSCADATGGTGIASCTGAVASGAALDTSTLGAHSFTVTATSSDGATATQTISYTVIRPANTFSFALRTSGRWVLHVALSKLQSPGVVRVTVHVHGVPAVSLTKVVRTRSTLAFTIALARQLRKRMPRRHGRLAAVVSLSFSPHGGLPMTRSERVTFGLM